VFHVKHIPGEAGEHLEVLGITARREAIDRLGEFADLLESAVAARRFGNLLGPGEISRIWSRHMLESAAYLPLLSTTGRVVDIGSGAGFPGIVLAVLGKEVTLVECRRKRFLFLLWVKENTRLPGLRLVNGRVEDCGPYPEGTAFTARAVDRMRDLPAVLSLAAPRGYTLTVRTGTPEALPWGGIVMKLPSPPLDRPGFMVQFRHPGTALGNGNRGE
jgi:16S rRNA (guanine527-N7)-methyltransferase